ncbi:hypothetical protein BSL78_28378 [Apostichopus japonicus]|uniref:PiggyBac transposable element-derived protein domain-containing protein n=1 Tax=Stichopus japonicus TaxID=307972 RepID=A0A2G8JGA3_STIJA|nr:hypothetical protein BSL78_28378 [Apostichopus japonicus]
MVSNNQQPQQTPGSTRKTPVQAVPPSPPPQRFATPPPVLDATSRAEFKQRCEARKATLGGFNKKLSPQEAHEKWTLLVEDNEDRSNCCGDWLWEDFTEDVHQRYLHVPDNKMGEKTANGRFCNKFYKVPPLLDSLVQSFQKHYSPGRELRIDEMMIGTKCRPSFLQYMKDKPTNWG